MELTDRIALFVTKADEISVKHWEHMKFTHAPAPRHRADYISAKWCRVVTIEHIGNTWKDTSVYCFICLQDGQTKALGVVKVGDVHKAAGYKAPAKTARGNVFNDDFHKYLTPYGPVYLKGY